SPFHRPCLLSPPAHYLSFSSPFFFSYRYAALRDLHSFPTRRSSDLRIPRALRPRPPQLPDQRRYRRRQDDAAQRALRIHRRARTDRKSTRLNSSHVEISYAVFCLKKKKSNVAGGQVRGIPGARLISS